MINNKLPNTSTPTPTVAPKTRYTSYTSTDYSPLFDNPNTLECCLISTIMMSTIIVVCIVGVVQLIIMFILNVFGAYLNKDTKDKLKNTEDDLSDFQSDIRDAVFSDNKNNGRRPIPFTGRRYYF
jgi:hypothetical protein